MSPVPKLKHPWLVAVWPGMGHIALSAGYYLLAKLGMHQLAEFTATGLFDVDQIADREKTIDSPEEFTVPVEEESMNDADRKRIESLFRAAQQDRAKAYELKQVLDELEVFDEFEDRFLDLFKSQA